MQKKYKKSWKEASSTVNSIYGVFTSHDVDSSRGKSSYAKIKAGLILGNLFTLGLCNVGMLIYNKNRMSTTAQLQIKECLITSVVPLSLTQGPEPRPTHNQLKDWFVYILNLSQNPPDKSPLTDYDFGVWWNHFLQPQNAINAKNRFNELVDKYELRSRIELN